MIGFAGGLLVEKMYVIGENVTNGILISLNFSEHGAPCANVICRFVGHGLFFYHYIRKHVEVN